MNYYKATDKTEHDKVTNMIILGIKPIESQNFKWKLLENDVVKLEFVHDGSIRSFKFKNNSLIAEHITFQKVK